MAFKNYPQDYMENGIYYHYCSACQEFHDAEQFYLTSDKGLMRICKEIQKEKNRINVQRHRDCETTQNQNVKEEAERILTVLGYELNNDDNPVHEQFKRRIERKYGGLR